MHNIRIERLWLDVTNGFGAKWKELFRQLEALYGLNTDHDAHIWLLHHLFLEAINCDAEQWAASWNHHVVSRRGDRHMTPAQMYIQGIARHGQRGVLPPTGPILEPEIDVNRSSDEDYADYGIDWTEMDQSRIRAHHDTYNLDDGDPTNPFLTNHPTHLSHIEIPDSRCPFVPDQIARLDEQLARLPCFRRDSMQACLELWVSALHIVQHM